MKSKTLILTTLLLCGMAMMSVNAAPLGTAFTYQGRLNDAAGSASGNYDLRFGLFDAVTDGSAVGSPLTHAAVAVSNGLFTVALDFGSGIFNGDARWLEIAVRTNGGGGFTALTPRQPITPAPYALYALTPAGPTGPQGAQGLKGDKGDPGEAGAQGPAGAVGAQGPQGVSGPAGLQGPKGDKGDVGLTGPQGSTGAAGPQGAKGDTGSTGLTGSQGLKGDKGDTGLTGATGAQGLQGVAGATGAVGPQGPQGATGTTGAIGPQGATGTAGPAGPEGLQWRGAWSAGTAYAIDDAVSHNGSSWMAKLANTGSTPVEGGANWDLLAKKGDTGATGSAGPQGAAGATGATGSQGPVGATGPQGPQGTAGPAGASGAFSLAGTSAYYNGGNVGVGTAAPTVPLHVESSATGSSVLAAMLEPNLGIGGFNQIYLGRTPTGNGCSTFTYTYNAADPALSSLSLGLYNNSYTLNVLGNGNVGIGTASPTRKLEVAGDTRINGRLVVRGGEDGPLVVVTESGFEAFGVSSSGKVVCNSDLFVEGHAYKALGGTSWETLSDLRLKQDVLVYEPGLNEVLQLRPVRFRYRDDSKMGLTSAQEEVGFIAQEVREVIPDAVTERKDGYLSLKADPIHWAAINAIQELNTKLEAQHAASQAKDARIEQLEQRLEKLEQLMNPQNGGAR